MSSNNRNRIRAQAAKICAIAASGGVAVQSWPSSSIRLCREYRVISRETDSSEEAIALAYRAWEYVMSEISPRQWTSETDAEAEALIRDGWFSS